MTAASPRAPWWLILVVLALASSAAAEEENFSNPPLTLRRIHGDLFMETRYRTEERTGRLTSSQDSLLIKEGMNLHLAGHAWHPALFDWNTSLRIGGSHERGTLNDDRRDSDGLLLGYTFTGLLLKERPLSIRLHATGMDETVQRSFARTVDVESNSQSVTFNLRGPIHSTFMLQQRQRSELSDIRFDEEQAYLLRYTATDNRRPDRHTTLTVEHEQVDRTNRFLLAPGDNAQQQFTDQRTELTMTNRWLFGEGPPRHQLSGHLRLMHRRGTFEHDAVRLSQRLDLNHSPKFATFYYGLFSHDSLPDQDERTISGGAGFRRSIYESLDITGRVNARHRELLEGQELNLGGDLDLAYRKHTPIGYYRSNLLVGREYREQDFEATLRAIRDEAVTLSGIGRVTLGQINIDPRSIRVTDRFNQVRYIEGIDYAIVQVGATTEIIRLAGGSIEDGETVLVDYSALTARDATTFIDNFAWRHRIDLEPWPLAVYGHYRLRQETLIDGADPGTLEHDQSWLGGAEWTVLPGLLLLGEFEHRTLRLSPSWDAWRVRASYNRALGPRAGLVVSADYQMLQYRDAERFGLIDDRDHLETLGAGARLTQKLSDHLLLRLDGSYRQNRGRQRDQLLRFGSALQWQYGQLEASLDAAIEQWEQETTDGTRAMVGISVKRRF